MYKKEVKNSFALVQNIAVLTLCVCTLFFIALGCDKQDSDEGVADIDAESFVEQLKSSPYANVSKETLSAWLVVRINDYYETRPSLSSKVLIYKGEWNKHVVYFIMDTFSSCICDFFTEDGGRIADNLLSNIRAKSKNWMLIYEYGELF